MSTGKWKLERTPQSKKGGAKVIHTHIALALLAFVIVTFSFSNLVEIIDKQTSYRQLFLGSQKTGAKPRENLGFVRSLVNTLVKYPWS